MSLSPIKTAGDYGVLLLDFTEENAESAKLTILVQLEDAGFASSYVDKARGYFKGEIFCSPLIFKDYTARIQKNDFFEEKKNQYLQWRAVYKNRLNFFNYWFCSKK